eukprot:6213171-Pleurochrysis_carterae.AAC.3
MLPTPVQRLKLIVRNHAKVLRAPKTLPGSTQATEWVGKECKKKNERMLVQLRRTVAVGSRAETRPTLYKDKGGGPPSAHHAMS